VVNLLGDSTTVWAVLLRSVNTKRLVESKLVVKFWVFMRMNALLSVVH
jgi:hypothetical protein